ncbi:MAG: hemolysin III family protein [Proteobacteria bacterium]|nr:hemolysin III family protein [Pseudomonadota bacterium]
MQMESVKEYEGTSRRPMEKGRNPYDGLRPWSAITHGVGILLSAIGTFFMLYKVVPQHDGTRIAGFCIFCATSVILYTASTLYHSVNTSVSGRILLRKIDHMAVNLLIAGTYTPLCLTILAGTAGNILLAIIWTLAVGSCLLSFFWINSPRWLTAGVYIALGWVSVITVPMIYQAAGMKPLFWMVLGGVLYTIGGILYALKWPGRNNPRFGCHEIFHVFIVLGTIGHYFMIYRCMA